MGGRGARSDRFMNRNTHFQPFVDCLEGRVVLSSTRHLLSLRPVSLEVSSNPGPAVTTIPMPRDGAMVDLGPGTPKRPWREVHARLVESMGRSRPRTIFLGDSITARWSQTAGAIWNSRFTRYRPANAGISGDWIQSLLWRVENGAVASQPKVAVVMIGINNVSLGYSAKEVVMGIQEVVAAIRRESPSTRVLLIGLLPTRETWETQLTAKVNLELAKWANQESIDFVDASRRFLDAEGQAKDSLLLDRVHLSKTGYQVLAGAIARTLARLNPPARA